MQEVRRGCTAAAGTEELIVDFCLYYRLPAMSSWM